MKIVIINPNSSQEMTQDIHNAALHYSKGRFEVVTLPTPGAPQFIDTFEDRALAANGMMEIVRKYEDEVDAFIVACHCDPNLHLLREISRRPIVGIGEASFYIAAMLGNTFSVISTGEYSNPYKENLIRSYNLENRLASIRVPDDTMEDDYTRYVNISNRAMIEDGTEVIILGCAGLCQMAEKMSNELGIPVLDGVVCGLAIAEGMINADLSTSKFRYYSHGQIV